MNMQKPKKGEKVTWYMGKMPKTNEATSLRMCLGYQVKTKKTTLVSYDMHLPFLWKIFNQ